ncbi:hypothetical protein pb186bvf_000519 [Paramecium bursaria]
MKIILILALLGCSLAYTEEDDVLVLTKDTFQQALDEFKYILVEFYAPWCGHCKKLAPEYSAAAKELKKVGDGYVPLAKVDATVESSVAEKYDVQGYPTLKFFVNGSPLDFEGGRNAAEIIAWITKKTGPASQELNADDLQAFIDKASSSPVVVFFGTDADDKDFVTFKQVALSNEKLLFGHTFDQQAKEQHNPKGKIVLFKGFDEKRNDLEEALTEESFKTFLNANSVPTLLPFNDKAIGVIFQQRNNALFLFTDDTEAGQAAYEAFASVAAPYKDRLKFSFSKQSDGFGLFGRLAEYIGASQTDIPNIMLFDQATNGKFKFQGEINADSIRQFVESFFDGRLTRYMKSEEIPASNDDPVKIVVGKNFQDLVLNNDKDVLIEFYAPWCGHCKQLAPIYEELAKELSVNPNIVIAKCDATGNEIEGVNVESFPTLKFWKNGQKDTPIAYNGGRDKQAFLEWLKENTSHPWIDLDRASEL